MKLAVIVTRHHSVLEMGKCTITGKNLVYNDTIIGSCLFVMPRNVVDRKENVIFLVVMKQKEYLTILRIAGKEAHANFLTVYYQKL